MVGDTNRNSCIERSLQSRTSRIDSLLNLTPLYTFVYNNVVSVSEISAVNLIIGCKLFAFRRKSYLLSLFLFHIDIIDESFPEDWFCVALSEYFIFYFGHKNVSESYGHTVG